MLMEVSVVGNIVIAMIVNRSRRIGFAITLPFTSGPHRCASGSVNTVNGYPLILALGDHSSRDAGIDPVNIGAERKRRQFGLCRQIHDVRLAVLPIGNVEPVFKPVYRHIRRVNADGDDFFYNAGGCVQEQQKRIGQSDCRCVGAARKCNCGLGSANIFRSVETEQLHGDGHL